MRRICPRFFVSSTGRLCTLPNVSLFFCLFCTERHVSMCHFTQFSGAAKEIIEIYKDFMYNGTIRVSAAQMEGASFPKGVKNDYVHC